jgi:hypothetical protein
MSSLIQGVNVMSITRLSAAAFAACLCTLSVTATAASACKGLPEATCAAEQSCRWVNAYVRKDGREVAGYCRISRAGTPVAEPSAKAPTVSAVD